MVKKQAPKKDVKIKVGKKKPKNNVTASFRIGKKTNA